MLPVFNVVLLVVLHCVTSF